MSTQIIMRALCSKKHDSWKCSGGYDIAFAELVLTSANGINPAKQAPEQNTKTPK